MELTIVIIIFVVAASYVGRTFIKQFTSENAGCHCNDCGAKTILDRKSEHPS